MKEAYGRNLLIAGLIAGTFAMWGCDATNDITNPDHNTDTTAVDTIAPGVVTNVQITIGDGSVTLIWENPTGDFAYVQIRRSETQPVTTTSGTVVYEGAGTNTYLDTGLSNGTTYYYGLIAYDAAGNASAVTTVIGRLPATETVTFYDTNLEDAVRSALGLPPGDITTTDLLSLTELDAGGMGISDIRGIEHCVNLRILKLDDNDLDNTDVDGLLGLQALQELDLGRNPLTSMPDFSGLPALNNLSIADDSMITNLGTVGSLTTLRTLDISRTGITSFAPIASAPSLTTLSFFDTPISDLTPLQNLGTLTALYGGNNGISDLSPLAGLTKLKHLIAYGNEITDLSPLSGLTELTSITLMGNQIHDLQPLVENSDLGTGDNLHVENNPLLHDAVATEIPALQGRGVQVFFSAGMPTETIGIWEIESVNQNGSPISPSDYFGWDSGTVTIHVALYSNNTYLAQELDDMDDVVYYDAGTVTVDGGNVTIQMNDDDGNPVDPPETVFEGTWTVDNGKLVLTETDQGDITVLTWSRVE